MSNLPASTADRAETHVDVVIVGAGFSGLYMLHRMRKLGFSTRVFETGGDVGGTWYWNRYPGARCDVASLEYSYSFDDDLQQEWNWTEKYATQPEILAYLNHVADRYDLRGGITFDTAVTGARFDDEAGRWLVETSSGETVSARHLVMATGCLSASRVPDFPGLERFRGETYHTGRWPHEPVSFAGKRVGVIGTGSSAIQTIPMVAREARHLHVFQRTPTFSVPAQNRPLGRDEILAWKSAYPEKRHFARHVARTGWIPEPAIGKAVETAPDALRQEFEKRWATGGSNFLYAFSDLGVDENANRLAADFVRQKIRETVKDPVLAEKLIPWDYPIGTKRICVDTDYYATYNRDNVTLVDVRAAPIEAITETGIRTADGEYEVDAIIFATGYDAMTGALTRLDLTGAKGARLADKWDAGPTNYLGIMTTGFPNFFMITGPGSPSVLSNVVVSIEQHVEWLADLFDYMRAHGKDRIEPTREAEAAWVEHCRALAAATLQMKANSWYLGANVPGKPRVFLPYIGGTSVYRQKCDEVAAKGYEGFVLSSAPATGASMDRKRA
ncbi:MAG: NAD(P)/FAD-dependent oxidoreductase [Rhizobiaceae bacterium]